MKVLAVQMRRDLKLLLQSLEEAVNPLVFLFLAISLFALATGGRAPPRTSLMPAAVRSSDVYTASTPGDWRAALTSSSEIEPCAKGERNR